jgi:signal transduction histidine kinase/HAMP domain-containing protein
VTESTSAAPIAGATDPPRPGFGQAFSTGRGLYQPVGLLSATVALLVLGITAVLYDHTHDDRYLAIAALAGMVLLANLLGALISHRRGRAGLAVWLLASGTLLAALLAPLFIADVWMPNLLLLAAVPIQVGAVDRFRRILPATIVAILAAAAMVTIDLLDLPDRSTVLVDRPGGVLIAAAVFAAQLAMLVFLLWWLRLRSGARHYVRLDLATQLPLVFVAISSISILVVTGVLVAQIRDSQVAQVERNFRTLAEISAERVGNSLDAQIGALLALGRRGTTLLEGLDAAIASYPESVTEREQLLAQREADWRASPDASDFVLRYRNNEESLELSRFRGADLLHSNVVLVDRFGGLVAAQGARPEQFSFTDEPWWQAAYGDGQGGVYLGDLVIEPDTGDARILIAVGVLNPSTNQTVGVLASTYRLVGVQREITGASVQVSGDVRLLAADGRLLAGPVPTEVGQIPAAARLALGMPPAPGEPGSGSGDRAEPPALLLAQAPLGATSLVNTDVLAGLGWRVVVSDEQSAALAEVSRSTKVAGLAGLLAIALGVIAVVAIARVVTRPIEALTATASAISAGDLEHRANPVGPVEMVTLAEAFNTLTGRLRSLISSLQEQVAQRTGQLEARVDQLATLNRMTQTVASVHDLNTALGHVTRELVGLFRAQSSGVALRGPDGETMTVLAEHSRNGPMDEADASILPLAGGLSSLAAIANGRSLVVPDAQTNPLTAPLHELLAMRGTQCLMIVPLLVRGEVIGTIAVASDERGREFSEGEVALAETVAGQVASALESGRLFAEMEAAKEAAEAANEAKSTFLASVSHELRTPLTSVLGFAKVIRRQLDERILPHVDAEDQRTQRAITQVRENVAVIVTEGERLTTLVNNVLDLAKIEAGRFEWRMQSLSVADVIDRAAVATASLFEAKGLELRREAPADLPQVVADRDGLMQVVINLLSNAVKFTERGSVTSRAAVAEEGIVVSVSDTGIGIAREDQEKVFEKFTQVGDTLTDKPHGTGLGLPICREIIERHGGRIWVESEVGSGSTFSFALPLLPSGPDEPVAEAAPAHPPPTTGRGGA